MAARLQDKVCVITGGTSGIGRETVELFIKHGAKVVFCGRGEKVGNEIAQALGECCVFVKADVTKEEEVEQVIETAVKSFGRLDCLFNNAGGAVRAAAVQDFTKEVSQAVFDLNFNSMAFATKYAIPHMISSPGPCSIINNSSIAASKAGFGSALYSASKAAMNAYMRTAAMELAPQGIRVNSVSPGATATPIFWGGSPGHKRGMKLSKEDNEVRMKKVQDNIVNHVSPLRVGRSGHGRDIAAIALFLASDESLWITGQDITVDGGITVFDAPNKGWMADKNPVDPVPLRNKL